ncbi:hypothetical protein GGI11_009029, partial [Coemansia sp. RSA 2049]
MEELKIRETTEKHGAQVEADDLLAGDTIQADHDDLQAMVKSVADSSSSTSGGSDDDDDDNGGPALTFRVLVLGTVFSIALAFVNMYYWFRSNPISVGIA